MEPGKMIDFMVADKVLIKAEQDGRASWIALAELAGKRLAQAQEDFWNSIRALHPELAEWEFIIDQVSETFVILGPRKK